jgi:hypothetical protein
MDMRSRSPEHSDIFIEVYRNDWDRLVRMERLANLQPHVMKDAVELLREALHLLVNAPNHVENKERAAKRVYTTIWRLNKFLRDPYFMTEPENDEPN